MANETIRLQGIAWNHTRGFVPMVATAQRFSELHPDVEISWQKRSLQAFGDQPIEQLAQQFDLLVIDHPFVGYAAAHPVLLPLDEHLPADFLADQASQSVGASYPSYHYGGHLWALPIDAATPVSAYRGDLLARAGVGVRQTWSDLLALARRGLVALPAIPIDSLMNFYMCCGALGEDPFLSTERVVDPSIGTAALAMLRELVALCDPACLTRNPIQTYELLAAGDHEAYCPFAYGYSNYARPGYAAHLLRFGGLVHTDDGRPLRSTLGGTGLAISRICRHPEAAAAYAAFVAAPACQSGLYLASGGQPGHRSAWTSAAVNAACGDFFADTLATLDAAFLRPRYAGYLHFQDHGGPIIHAYLRDGGDPRAVVSRLDALYRESRPSTQ
ncbi:MAG TPA: extracellular solute-binding protein [Roseiflexaceae bacterium]|nr:extracellular solute-binding protein [Roseiflexaceae bacterium]